MAENRGNRKPMETTHVEDTILCFHGKTKCSFCFGASGKPQRCCPACGRLNFTGHICRTCIRAGVIDAPRLPVDPVERERVSV